MPFTRGGGSVCSFTELEKWCAKYWWFSWNHVVMMQLYPLLAGGTEADKVDDDNEEEDER